MIDLLNNPVEGTAGGGGGGIDFSIPFVEGIYELEIEEIGEWKERPVIKNYEVKKYNFESKKSEVVEVLDEVQPFSAMIKFRVITAPEGHEDLEGRNFNHFLNLQPNTMGFISNFVAGVVGKGNSIAPSMFQEFKEARVEAKLEPDTYETTKQVQDPDTGIMEEVVFENHTAKVKTFVAK